MIEPRFKHKYKVKSIRLPNRDYGANGGYFVTICTHQKQHFFGNVVNGQMCLSPIGEIAQKYWADIPNHFDFVHLDAYVIMPNHMHGIVVIDRPHNTHDTSVETLQCNVSTCKSQSPRQKFMSAISPNAGSLGAIARSYKSAVTYWCSKNGHDYFKWQPRFYEHIIRDNTSLDRIREYIINNPIEWREDKNNPINLWI
jgi:putative transposase